MLLLSAVLAIEIREKTGLYRTIVRQFREAITERDDLRRQLRQQEADAADDGKEKHSSPDARMAEGLWRALMKEMEENEVYPEPGMSREALAKLLKRQPHVSFKNHICQHRPWLHAVHQQLADRGGREDTL